MRNPASINMQVKERNNLTPEYDEVRCTKETLSRTIIEIEKEYEILEINTITNYFGYFSYFQIFIKKEKR